MHEGVELELIEEEEMLDGLLILTDGNMGAACSLLEKAKKETVKAIKATLKRAETPLLDSAIKETARQDTLNKIGANLDRELRRGRRRAQYALNKNMRNSSYHAEKPTNTANHHLVALTDPRAKISLQILLAYSIDPSDEANGINLPRYARHTKHSALPNAIAHSKTHTDFYYGNVDAVLLDVDVPGATREDVIKALRYIAQRLQAGVFPTHKVIEL